ncbi:pentatricopeptide repeat-containing protein At1g74630-like [Aristolochia californica]|uniref:pentatricopeptide repeat-containing protein At1g74630-like n=1 Tax=Aristolochia californica TaxID=171875 RepID=UPI0035D7278A
MSSSLQLCLSLLRNCRTIGGLNQIHSRTLKAGLDQNPLLVGQLLLSAVTVSDAIDFALSLFAEIASPDVFMRNTLIRGFSESGSPHEALLMYTQMRHQSVVPDSFSFAFLFKAAANMKSLDAGTQLHCQALLFGLDTHLFVRTTLISTYAEAEDLTSAQRAFDETEEPNVVTWNAIVTAYFRCSDLVGADQMFNKMPVRDLTSWNIMLAGYTKAGELEVARRLFNEMPDTDSISWSTMIVGFAHNGCLDEAFYFFRESQRMGMGYNEVSLTGILSVSAQVGAFMSGKVLHGYIVKAGLNHVMPVTNALLDVYAKCGDTEMARGVFYQMMENKSVISWSIMMAALAMQGQAEEVQELFAEMEKSEIRPDGVTFVSMLYACSHAGLIDQACGYFHKMKESYELEPSIEHYGCMVDLYSRAGLLNQAYEFITDMPIEPNEIIWRTLLGACSIHGELKLAEEARKKLSELDPDNSSDYILLSNIYAIAGKWNDVAVVRRSMVNRNINKTPGWSTIEVDKVVHKFVAGDRESEVANVAHSKLAEIMSALRTAGYVPETRSVLHDIEDEDKEDSVSQHSEKLAVAFGLAKVCQGTVIRIVKNLRVCRDCHTVMKLISKVYHREILLRDRSRFHSLKDGSCSCKDYW